jgi:hypothetical protein
VPANTNEVVGNLTNGSPQHQNVFGYPCHYAEEQLYSGNKAHPGKLTETSFMKYSFKTEQLVMRIAVISLLLMVVSTSAFASCYTNARGRVVCNNGEEAGGYNANTGTAWKSERNSNGVATTQTSRGGEAK